MTRIATRPAQIAAALGLGLALCNASWATPAAISARITADDHYAAYIGGADGSNLTLLGADSDWLTAEDYAGFGYASDYFYVVAWNNPLSGTMGFQGAVTGPNGTTYTSDAGWEAIRRPAPSSTFNAGGTPPATAALAAEIFGAVVWETNIVSAPANASPWLDVHGGGQAQWIWLDSFDATPGEPSQDYVIFRTSVMGTANSVPEPTPLALLAIAASGLALRRRQLSSS